MKTIENVNDLKSVIKEIEKLELGDKQAEIILGYFEGHDYVIKTDKKTLFVVDFQDETDIWKEDFREIVGRVIEWNNDLIKETKDKLYKYLGQLEEFTKTNRYMAELRSNENILNNLDYYLEINRP